MCYAARLFAQAMPRRSASTPGNTPTPPTAAPSSVPGGDQVAALSSMEVEALTAAVEALVELLSQEELTAAVDTLAHLLHEQGLTAAVEALTHQVRHLATIVDEVREELVWSVRNPRAGDGETWRPNMTSSLIEEKLVGTAQAPPTPVEAATNDQPPSPTAQPNLFH